MRKEIIFRKVSEKVFLAKCNHGFILRSWEKLPQHHSIPPPTKKKEEEAQEVDEIEIGRRGRGCSLCSDSFGDELV